jgi:hypothetical protein
VVYDRDPHEFTTADVLRILAAIFRVQRSQDFWVGTLEVVCKFLIRLMLGPFGSPIVVNLVFRFFYGIADWIVKFVYEIGGNVQAFLAPLLTHLAAWTPDYEFRPKPPPSI